MSSTPETAKAELPPIQLATRVFRKHKEYGGRESVVVYSSSAMRHLIELALGPYFDENFYVSTYQDVKQEIEKGAITSGLYHYTTSGFYEGRLPCDIKVDEEWYTKNYPDVQAAIASQKYSSAKQHFCESGFAEGRYPNAKWKTELEPPEVKK